MANMSVAVVLVLLLFWIAYVSTSPCYDFRGIICLCPGKDDHGTVTCYEVEAMRGQDYQR